MSFYDDEIKRLKKEQSREKKLDEYGTVAQELRDAYDAYVAVGFTEE